MKKITRVLFFITMLGTLIFTGCSKSVEEVEETETTEAASEESTEEVAEGEIDEPIKMGIVAGDVNEEVWEIARNILEDKGYKVETVMFNDFNSPNQAVADGAIGYNFYQHEPFLNSYNEGNGTDLVKSGQGIYANKYAVFSSKVKNIDEVTDGMTVAIQSDNTNRSRSLFMLQDFGLIKLKDGVEMPTILDIEENPKNLDFLEMEATMIPSSYKDVDIACSVCSRWLKAGNTMDDELISVADLASALIVVSNKDNADGPTAKLIQEALCSQEVEDYLNDKYAGAVEVVFE